MTRPDAALRALSDRLTHDLAKYLTRIAQNVPPAELPAPSMLPLLTKDLYETYGGVRGSEHFEGLLRETIVRPEWGPAIQQLRHDFAVLDELEAGVRRGEKAALRVALETARRLARALQRFPKAVSEAHD